MHRKLIKQKTAYTITLPIKWIRENNYNPGDELIVSEEQDNLIITGKRITKKKEISINLDEGNEHYYRIMIENRYLKGYDVINVTFSNPSIITNIQKIVSNLIGIEITNQTKTRGTISETSNPTNNEFSSLLRRCFNIIRYSKDLIIGDLNKKSLRHLNEIIQQTEDARRFLLFCTRVLHKNNITSREDESFFHLLLERLILIQHNNKYMYEKLSKIKKLEIRKEVLGILEKSFSMFELFAKDFYNKTTNNFSKINKFWEEIYFKEGNKLIKKSNEEESIILFHAMHLSKLIFLISQPNQIEIEI